MTRTERIKNLAQEIQQAVEAYNQTRSQERQSDIAYGLSITLSSNWGLLTDVLPNFENLIQPLHDCYHSSKPMNADLDHFMNEFNAAVAVQ